MEDELWIEKELERIRQEFNLTDEQFNHFREQRSLESQITQERIKEVHQLFESKILTSATTPSSKYSPGCWMPFYGHSSCSGNERSYVDLSERLLTMITSQERRLCKLEQELEMIKHRIKEAA